MSKYWDISIVSIMVLFFARIIVYPLFKEVIRFYQLKSKATKTKGKIVNVEELKDSDGLKMYKPIIEYIANDNKFYFTPNDATMYKPSIGKHIEIIYDAESPQKASINNKRFIAFMYFKVIFTLGILMILFFLLVKAIKSFI